jgi:hypothetical protein
MCNQCDEQKTVSKRGINLDSNNYSFDNLGIGSFLDNSTPADIIPPGDPIDALLNNFNTVGNANDPRQPIVVKPIDLSSFASSVGNAVVSGAFQNTILPTAVKGVSGQIIDASGDPAIAATVIIGEGNFTYTDFDGNFEIPNAVAPLKAQIHYQDEVFEHTLGEYTEITLESESLDAVEINATKSKFPWLWVTLGTVTIGGIAYLTSDKTVKATI